MNTLRRYIIWLSRISHCRGFGVQSPSAYRFIRYVVSEHYPYYAYSSLRRQLPHLDWLLRKKMELYLRIANHCQAPQMISHSDGTHDATLQSYISSGCRKTTLISIGHGSSTTPRHNDTTQPQLVRICPTEGCEDTLHSVLSRISDDTLLIIEDIKTSDRARRMWQSLTLDPHATVTYDLYYLGIASFNHKMHKTNYIVNF